MVCIYLDLAGAHLVTKAFSGLLFAFVLKNLHGGWGNQIMAQTTWCMLHMEETAGGTGPEVGQSDNNILYY